MRFSPQTGPPKFKLFNLLTLYVPGGGGKFAAPLSYFIIAPKLKKSFALMHPDFESNLIKHIFIKFGVNCTTGNDVIFAFARGTQRVSYSFEHNSCFSVRLFYSLYCVFIIDVNF